MKKWLIIGAVFIALIVGLCIAIRQASTNEKKWKEAMANIKAYDTELSAEKEKNVAYKLTVDQLGYFKDSILRELDSVRRDLKIKDKNLQALQYVASNFSKKDTVTLKDTIFLDPSLALDTLIGDEWYKVQLGLKYPSTITVNPQFTSKKYIVVSTKKETVNPPKKFFLCRLFQKKHTILQVDVVEGNPYVSGGSSKYIEIIK